MHLASERREFVPCPLSNHRMHERIELLDQHGICNACHGDDGLGGRRSPHEPCRHSENLELSRHSEARLPVEGSILRTVGLQVPELTTFIETSAVRSHE